MSSILQPEIVVIGTRRYRRNVNKIIWQDKPYRDDEHRPYEEETEDMYQDEADPHQSSAYGKKELTIYDQYEDEVACKMEHIPKANDTTATANQQRVDKKNDEDDEYKDIVYDNGMFKLKMSVSEAYYGYIIGPKGEKKKNLENETQTTIIIPNRNRPGNSENEFLAVQGKSKVSEIFCFCKKYIQCCQNCRNWTLKRGN
jgi:hypothetical protein